MMIKTGVTINEAAHEWVGQFNAIPRSVVVKLIEAGCNSTSEITPPSMNDRVYLCDGEHNGEYGEIVETRYDGEEDMHRIAIDVSDDDVILSEDEFEVKHDDFLPMWGTMWTFGDGIDNWWLKEKEGLQAMADCGFRIYESEDFEYIFGIDGAGYDFYEAHWIPLYNARGLQRHDMVTEDGSDV